ncbi:MAG: hypothetical protein WD673_03240 [Alphaproteobacteria bacterium]
MVGRIARKSVGWVDKVGFPLKHKPLKSLNLWYWRENCVIVKDSRLRSPPWEAGRTRAPRGDKTERPAGRFNLGDITMKTSFRSWAVGIASVCALVAGAGSASALTITHNGVGFDIPGSEDVDVLVTQELGLCEFFGGMTGDLCIEKLWLPGSQDQVHELTITLDSTGDEGFLFVELVLNATGVPWTDYHLTFSDVDMVECCEAIILTELFAFADPVVVVDEESSSFSLFFESLGVY